MTENGLVFCKQCGKTTETRKLGQHYNRKDHVGKEYGVLQLGDEPVKPHKKDWYTNPDKS